MSDRVPHVSGSFLNCSKRALIAAHRTSLFGLRGVAEANVNLDRRRRLAVKREARDQKHRGLRRQHGELAVELRPALGCREAGLDQLLSVPLDLRALRPLASGRSSPGTLRSHLPEMIDHWSMQKVSARLALRTLQMWPY